MLVRRGGEITIQLPEQAITVISSEPMTHLELRCTGIAVSRTNGGTGSGLS